MTKVRKIWCIKLLWVLLLLMVVISSVFLFRIANLYQTSIETNTDDVTEEYLRKFTPQINKKHITKSLKELGKMDDTNKYFLFLNFIPNSGAEILIFLLERIQGLNNFKHVRLKGGGTPSLTNLEQESLVNQVYDIRQNEPIPLSFDKSVFFINFTDYDKQSPTYMNLIRDPVEKVFSYKSILGSSQKEIQRCIMSKKEQCVLKNIENYDFSIPFFCGSHPQCLVANDLWALEIAKQNVEKFYPVVGILENLNTTLDVLESKMSYFFKGSKKIYDKYLYGVYKQRKKGKIHRKFRKIAEKVLKTEVQFYEWAKKRLSDQTGRSQK